MGEMRSRVSSLGTLTRWKCQNGLEALRQRPDECPPPALLDGVIGLFPVLTAGGPEFFYQSMTYHQGRQEGSMRGSFGFQPDNGNPFQAVCNPFPLRVPDFKM